MVYLDLRKALRHTHDVDKPHVRDLWRCVATRRKAHHAHKRAKRWWSWRKRYPQVWAIRFNRRYGYLRGTLETIASCESGGSPTAIGGGGAYRGKYQFDYGTWAGVGGSGDPAAAHVWEQDYRAAVLYVSRGSQPWPVCGV